MLLIKKCFAGIILEDSSSNIKKMKTENQTHLTLKAIDIELKAMLKKDLAKHHKQLNRAAK